MNLRSFDPVHVVAAHLAVLVAVIHLALGVSNWLTYLSAGILLPPDLRWPLFVVSGLAIVVGLVAAIAGADRRPLYLGGITLMVVYVVGYFAWHASGHRPLFVVGAGTHHHGSTLAYLGAHVVAGPAETLSLVSETALAALLGYLLYREA
ncbi:hypothetical protein SAMN04488065_1986 [Haloplanus vescus]|uniref:Uncharacterized protein n=1 Tax=Haloplanus vescus TaxID=555874 RepID=A0A1H3YMQ7_9EURY|nr:hypothetical protein [Haloplanus vescus]SEA12830.1 hypothetical protein SAMN04488065_1986 [Haloplanus vescus]